MHTPFGVFVLLPKVEGPTKGMGIISSQLAATSRSKFGRHFPGLVDVGGIDLRQLRQPASKIFPSGVILLLRTQFPLELLLLPCRKVFHRFKAMCTTVALVHLCHHHPIPVVHSHIVVQKHLLKVESANSPIQTQDEDKIEANCLAAFVSKPARLLELPHACIHIGHASPPCLPCLHCSGVPGPGPLHTAWALQPKEPPAPPDGVEAVELSPKQAMSNTVIIWRFFSTSQDLSSRDAAHGHVMRHAQPAIRTGQIRPLQSIMALCDATRGQIPKDWLDKILWLTFFAKPLLQPVTRSYLTTRRQLLHHGLLHLLWAVA
mmetsp:Transcript_106011/g.252996  ORF Transcript_106011/g.252996 Transcript_106011/m.252996 type:complete len:318 (-) Transcript_106011:777-1730(-)